MGLHFVKMHGASNDFVILDEATGTVKDAPALAQRLCQPHVGVGADGLILLRPSTTQASRFIYLNADGSRAEMCGNGLRCAAHYLAWRHHLPSPLRIETDLGVRGCVVHGDPGATVADVEVEMGVVQTQGVAGGETWLGHPLALGSEQVPAFAVSTGNPHLVLLRRGERDEVDALGPVLSAHPAFVDGTNVEWVWRRGPGDCEVEVYERGVGRTLACGSGACATVSALILAGHEVPGQPVRVRMPGGELQVTIDESWRATLRGPSALVFEGALL